MLGLAGFLAVALLWQNKNFGQASTLQVDLKIPNKGLGSAFLAQRKGNGFHTCASSHSVHNFGKVFEKTHLKIFSKMLHWMVNIFSWLIFPFFWSNLSKISKIQPRNILRQEIYLFKSCWRHHLSRCTTEKASLYLTRVKNIIIEGEGFQIYMFSSSSLLQFSCVKYALKVNPNIVCCQTFYYQFWQEFFTSPYTTTDLIHQFHLIRLIHLIYLIHFFLAIFSKCLKLHIVSRLGTRPFHITIWIWRKFQVKGTSDGPFPT